MGTSGEVQYETHGCVALLTIDNPPVNLLSAGVRQTFAAGLERAEADESIDIIVVTGAGRAFIAGADISEFGRTLPGPSLDELFDRVEACTKPVVAAINGVALGGGLEVALCCDYRIAAPRASLGLPEVKLGLLPGGGGTQRLPRLIGPVPALELILSGELVPAGRAVELGFVDKLIEGPNTRGQVIEGAIAYARELVGHGGSRRRIRDDRSRLARGASERELFSAAYQRAAARMPKRFAHEMIVQCVEAAVNAEDFDAGRAVERSCFAQCMAHPQHAALKHLFFAERSCGKIPGLDRSVVAQPIERAVVVADSRVEPLVAKLGKAGVEVITHDRLESDASGAVEVVVASGQTPELGSLVAALAPTVAVVLVVEGDELGELAAATGRPEQVVGLRLAPSGRVVEVMPCEATRDVVVATIMKLVRRMRTIAVAQRPGSSLGPLGEQILAAARRELDALIASGVEPSRLRHCLEKLGSRAEIDDAATATAVAKTPGEDEILERYLKAWADAAQQVVDAERVHRASDVDVLCVHGYGFPEVFGGPLHWASTRAQNP